MTVELRHYLVPYTRREEDDPLFEELTYGHSGNKLSKVKIGEFLFFHTKILGNRYITAYYQVFEKKSVKEIREQPLIKKKYLNHHIFNGEETDIVIFGHPVYSYVLKRPLLLSDELLFELTGGKKINPGKLVMNDTKEEHLLQLIHEHEEKPLDSVSLTTEDIFHLREKDIENLLCSNPTLLGEDVEFVSNQKHFDDKTILDVLLKDRKGSIIVEIKKGLINQDVYTQIKGYIKNYKNDNPQEDVRGIIVCRGFDSEQSKEFYTEKIKNGKIKIYLHAWKFNLKEVSALDLLQA